VIASADDEDYYRASTGSHYRQAVGGAVFEINSVNSKRGANSSATLLLSH
jgi:hypothetical protein